MQEERSIISHLNLASTIFADTDLLDEHDKRIRKIKESAPAAFCIPACHVEEFAIRIAIKLHLDARQLDVLVKMLPKFLWSNTGFESWLKDAAAFNDLSDSALSDLKDLLSALKSLLNPREYFSKKENGNLSQHLLKAAKILNNESDDQRTRGDADLLWRVFKKTIYFQDLTCPALLLSGAICTLYCPEEILPDIVAPYMEDLSCYLYRYQEKKFIKERLGIQNNSDKSNLSPKTKYIEMDIKKQPFYNELMLKIEKQIIGIDSISRVDDLSLEMVEKFWIQSKFSPKRQTAICVAEFFAPVKEAEEGRYQKAIRNLSPDQEAIICLKAYSRVMKKSVAVIENSVQDILLKKAMQFANSSGIEDTVKGGNSQ